MLPTPATNDWSSSSDLSRPLRRRSRRRKSRSVKSSASGSGPIAAKTAAPPTSVTSSPLTGSRPYSPTGRTCGCRGSAARARPRAPARAARTGPRACPAGTTNSWPVIFRWMVRAASPVSSMTSCFARRPTDRTVRPATASAKAIGSWVRSVRAHDDARADDRRAEEAGPEVARDRLDLGKLGHRLQPTPRAARPAPRAAARRPRRRSRPRGSAASSIPSRRRP